MVSRAYYGPFENAFYWGRKEHAWLLRAEGMSHRKIGLRLGVSEERSRQMVREFGRRVGRRGPRFWVDGQQVKEKNGEEVKLDVN